MQYTFWFLFAGVLEAAAYAAWHVKQRNRRERRLAQRGRFLPVDQYLTHRAARRGTTLETMQGEVWWTPDDVLALSPVIVEPADWSTEGESAKSQWRAFCEWCWPAYIDDETGSARYVPLRFHQFSGFGPRLPGSFFVYPPFSGEPIKSGPGGCLIGLLALPAVTLYSLGMLLLVAGLVIWTWWESLAARWQLPSHRRVTQCNTGEGTLIVEVRGENSPQRLWWTPDDVAALSPFPANNSDRFCRAKAQRRRAKRWRAYALYGSGVFRRLHRATM